MKMRKDLKYWAGFSHILAGNPRRFLELCQAFDSLEQAWHASIRELEGKEFFSKMAAKIDSARRSIDLNAALNEIQKYGIGMVTIRDDAYPARLREIHDTPPILFYREGANNHNDPPSPRATAAEGNDHDALRWLGQDRPCLAVVGSRKMTSYGRRVCEELVGEVARNDVVIVSGLALGIDACSHQAAIDSRSPTYGVLACGLDRVYPASNIRLAHDLMQAGGALISELPPGSEPLKHHFPMRNRIISGLAQGVLVVEAHARSGALITAFSALEQNRDVFAVPGSIHYAASAGTNMLIKKGAKPVTCAQDILEEFNVVPGNDAPRIEYEPESDDEKKLLDILTRQPLEVDSAIRQSGLDINVVNRVLTELELKGVIERLDDGTYVKT